jgi:hypothetical protein
MTATRIAAMAMLAVVAVPNALHATRMSAQPGFRLLTASEGKVWFLQPDGRGTTIDLASGAVARGGDDRTAWHQPLRCDFTPSGCVFAAGALTFVQQTEGEYSVDWKSANGSWQMAWRGSPRGGPPRTFWAVDGSLLLHTPDSKRATLECLDIVSGRPRWIYAYPSFWPFVAWTPLGNRNEMSAAHDDLLGFRGTGAAERREGTFEHAVGMATATYPYAGRVIVDPDPMRRSRVLAGLALGWAAAVAALAVVWLRIVGGPEWRRFTVMTLGLAVVIVAVGLIDPILVALLWLLFLGAFVSAIAHKEAPRILLLFVALITLVVVWGPSLLNDIQR